MTVDTREADVPARAATEIGIADVRLFRRPVDRLGPLAERRSVAHQHDRLFARGLEFRQPEGTNPERRANDRFDELR